MRKFLALILVAVTMIACDPTALTTDSRDALEGSWTCKELQTYQVTVSKAPLEEDKLYFDNLYNLHLKVEVIIAGNTLSIPNQTVSNYVLEGSGSVSADKRKMTLNFKADDETLNAVMTKN